jgi:hypothetical protein
MEIFVSQTNKGLVVPEKKVKGAIKKAERKS